MNETDAQHVGGSGDTSNMPSNDGTKFYRYLPTGPLAALYAGAVLRYFGPCQEAAGCIHLEGCLCVRESDVVEVA